MVDPQISAAICSLLNEVDTTSTDGISLGELRERIAAKRDELSGFGAAAELRLMIVSLDRVIFDIDVRIIDLQRPYFLQPQTPGASTANGGGL